MIIIVLSSTINFKRNHPDILLAGETRNAYEVDPNVVRVVRNLTRILSGSLFFCGRYYYNTVVGQRGTYCHLILTCCRVSVGAHRKAMKHVLDAMWTYVEMDELEVAEEDDDDEDSPRYQDLMKFAANISPVRKMDYQQRAALYAIRGALSTYPGG